MFNKLIGFFLKKTKKKESVLDVEKPIEIKKVLEEIVSSENIEKEITDETPKMDAKPKRKPRKKKDDN